MAVVHDEGVVHVPSTRWAGVHDDVALAEIELCGELMIAASASEERLSTAKIDEVLKVNRVQDSQGLLCASGQ